MEQHLRAQGTTFYVVGLSYKKADAEVRGDFSIDETTKKSILKQAKKEKFPGLLVISTCNRTELYGFAKSSEELIKLLCEHTHGTIKEFKKVAYVHKNNEAAKHLFRVGTGLDSQILGDFEIIGQIKSGFKTAKQLGMINPFLERLINVVIQASKRIKNETEISTGATSVSFAAVQYILAKVPYISDKNILLFGTGKIGRNTCENLVKHTKNDHIVLINRTKNKAEQIAGKFDLVVKDFEVLKNEIDKTDVLIVATGARNPTITKYMITSDKPVLILDLSVPKNVHTDVGELPNVTLVHMDYLSKMTDATLQRRQLQIPKAEKIIKEVESEFYDWIETRKFAPTIKALKQKLHTMKDAEIETQRKKISDFNEEQAEIISNRIIQKITNHFASHLKDENTSKKESIDLIRKVFQIQNK
ncbi:glutamyl-tRNA reductase [Aquimarina sp. ERC-38]|uniref:glutamyl-tRNA reductase n=1 Tax=Aquimarina sp. ERC-38 TaxID=2949996 RepID=UPI00224831D9|nr:glutamyl-tRNA reductase [Aquimarina sp. ERC-38]UZO81987.1 glutamyl-tRNA reductase [Aquimarina sp. ERC-38]